MLTFITSAIRFGMSLLCGSTGETITEKSGHLNLGIPGIMYVGGISGVKTIKSFCGIPMCFLCFAIMLGFIRYLTKRPRKTNGEYEYEAEVADAPDNGEPEAPLDGIDKLFRKLFGKKEA